METQRVECQLTAALSPFANLRRSKKTAKTMGRIQTKESSDRFKIMEARSFGIKSNFDERVDDEQQ